MFDELLTRPGVREDVALGSPVGFLALHGGLEPGTEAVAAIAARTSGASAYVVTQPRTLGWHVPSHRIDTARVPRLAAFLAHIEIVISVHGYWRPERPDALYVGGGNRALAARLAERLQGALPAVVVVDDLDEIPRAMRGLDPRNPVNATRGGGVQLELPHCTRVAGDPASPDTSAAARLTAALREFAVELA